MKSNRKYTIALHFALLLLVSIALAQEPFSYQPEDIPKEEIPEGMTAKEYIDSVYWERHGKIKITFHVTGEDGKPIPDADVNVGFDSLLHSDGYNNYYGKTDKDGMYTVEGRGQGSSQIIITKENYYPSMPKVNWDYELNHDLETIHKNGGYQPWDPTIEVTLKKIGKPTPMLVRLGSRAKNIIRPNESQMGKEYGWDLVEGDWIEPLGKGKVSDLLLQFNFTYTDEHNYSATLEIGFKNKNDGVIILSELKGEESLLKYPRIAPKNGYSSDKLDYFHRVNKNKYETMPTPKPKGYLLRVRTRVNADGKVLSALYGKIIGIFDLVGPVYGDGTKPYPPQVKFNYYLNLTPNDHNLEFDPAKNLAPEVNKRLRWDP